MACGTAKRVPPERAGPLRAELGTVLEVPGLMHLLAFADGLGPCLPNQSWRLVISAVLLAQGAGLIALAIKDALEKRRLKAGLR